MKGMTTRRLERYIRWFLKNPIYYRRFMDAVYGMSEEGREGARKDIVRAMKADGVVAPTTYWKDVNIGYYIAVINVRKLKAGK